MRDSVAPWICHMLAVFLAAYVLGRFFRNRFLAIVAATAVGVGVVCLFGAWQPAAAIWLEAHTYGMYVYGFRTISKDPGDFVTAFVCCWIAPIGIAWLTVRWRARKPRVDGVEE